MHLKKTLLLTLTAVSILFLSNSCKKCNVSNNDTNTGEIVSDAIIYPSGATLTSNYNTQLFDGVSTPSDLFQVSFDGGVTRVPIDWNSYYVSSIPMTVNCKTEFVRNISKDTLNGIVRYSVDATTCKDCDQKVTVENWVLVKKFPISYTVLYLPSVKEI